jgi:hypothetical protein
MLLRGWTECANARLFCSISSRAAMLTQYKRTGNEDALQNEDGADF